MFKRILVANRGEIAMRIIRTCRELGIESVALFSDADANAVHIVMADFAENLPGNSPAETYLNIDLIIDICKKYKVDALHPGYGFLAENADFAQACADNGIVFIGPSPQAIRDLGNKLKAKEIARAAGTPTVPGTESALTDVKDAEAFAKEAGFPLMLKAAAGGGGRGMRIVRNLEELPKLFTSCQNEARGAFGSDEIFIERYIEKPKHIEFQILADEHGNCIHLGERDCSIQRRHQKLIEEAPSPALTPELREEMGATAVALAKAAGYSNAGTVEFLLDQENRYYFMEMNTRLQVEHPVTEMVTFVDLVQAQLLIAAGNPLHIKQEDVQIRGWAFEARINAEDPLRGFVPDMGTLKRYLPPAGGGIRLDSGAYEGYTIPSHYDSMVGKLIAFARTREKAMAKMLRALDEYVITGVRTTIPFHSYVFKHPAFTSGNFHTGFIEEHFSDEKISELMSGSGEGESNEHIGLAAALQYYMERTALITTNEQQDEEASLRWKLIHRLGSTSYLPR
ncbi:acetyl-CoA carboxylase biotin carboxylase subunit [bacterium]|nr:acetyl-CoA carboxylase biotin carboxylase subunit [bacterium]